MIKLQKLRHLSCICAYCNKVMPMDERTNDHIIPRSANGQTEISNIVICCQDCNGLKSNSLINAFLKKYPEKAGLSMREVARRVNKTAATISKWESGETTPYGSTLLLLCKIYNVDISAFYGIETQQKIRITPAEISLLELFRTATKEAQTVVWTVLEKCQKTN